MSFVRSFIACILLKSAFLIWTMKQNQMEWNDQKKKCVVSKPIKCIHYTAYCTCIVHTHDELALLVSLTMFKCSYLKIVPTHIIVPIFRFSCVTLKLFCTVCNLVPYNFSLEIEFTTKWMQYNPFLFSRTTNEFFIFRLSIKKERYNFRYYPVNRK